MTEDLLHRWSQRLGLAYTPLFDVSEKSGTNYVLLDGGGGSFALSVNLGDDPRTERNWIWSANLPHHVSIGKQAVLVERWDSNAPERLHIDQVENRLEDFYRFLLLDRVRSRETVIEHTVTMFRRLRSLLALHNRPQNIAIELFLLELSAMMSESPADFLSGTSFVHSDVDLSAEAYEAATSLRDGMIGLAEEFKQSNGTTINLMLFPDLAVRHAGGVIFQEAHFELLRGGEPDLFATIAPARVRPDTRGGVHFTSPPLARLIAEEALKLSAPNKRIVVFDPACGSGAFLYEAARALGRLGFAGSIHLVGRDTSAFAVTMARYALRRMQSDWTSLKIFIDVQQQDALEEEQPWRDANVILTNPPFISWAAMNSRQRSQVSRILGASSKGQPDYCMAFIQQAICLTQQGTVVGTLIPASLLSLKSADRWRRQLLERAHLSLLSSFGEYGLFRYALIQVGAIVMRVQSPDASLSRIRQLWTAETPAATGDALRALRRIRPPLIEAAGDGWSINVSSVSELRKASDWRPRPKRLGHILKLISKVVGTTVSDLFTVHQGILPGARAVFVLSQQQLNGLPPNEHRFFRQVAEGRNIRNGIITPGSYLFFPTWSGLPKIDDEADLARLVPTYYQTWLEPNKPNLERRPAVRNRMGRTGGVRWWELNRPRPWQIEPRIKIVSAFFGQRGSFAWDEDGSYAVVQGNAWLPRRTIEYPMVRKHIYKSYLAMLNSKPFEQLLEEYCPRVAGGQFNLSKRFVDPIPLPDLFSFVTRDLELPRVALELANLQPDQFRDRTIGYEIDNAVKIIYGSSEQDW